MPEFQPECPLDDVLLFPVHQPGETPTSDSGLSDDRGNSIGDGRTHLKAETTECTTGD